MTSGWDGSAQAWIKTMGADGDWGRRHVLDGPMLDFGCGELQLHHRIAARVRFRAIRDRRAASTR